MIIKRILKTVSAIFVKPHLTTNSFFSFLNQSKEGQFSITN